MGQARPVEVYRLLISDTVDDIAGQTEAERRIIEMERKRLGLDEHLGLSDKAVP